MVKETQVRFVRALHVASGTKSPNKIVRKSSTGISNVRSSYVALAIMHINTIFRFTSNHGSQDWQKSVAHE